MNEEHEEQEEKIRIVKLVNGEQFIASIKNGEDEDSSYLFFNGATLLVPTENGLSPVPFMFPLLSPDELWTRVHFQHVMIVTVPTKELHTMYVDYMKQLRSKLALPASKELVLPG